MRIVLSITLAAMFIFTACTPDSRLPAKRPPDLVVELHEDGGMLPEGEDYYLAADSAHLRFWMHRHRNTLAFTPSKARMDALYETLRANKALRIRSEEVMAYDRGGASVQLRYGGEYHRISDAGMYFVEADWQDEFYNIVEAIRGTVHESLADRKQALRLTLTALPASDTPRYVSVTAGSNNLIRFNRDNNAAVPDSGSVTLYQGVYPLRAQVTFGEEHIFLEDSVTLADAPVELHLAFDRKEIRIVTEKEEE